MIYEKTEKVFKLAKNFLCSLEKREIYFPSHMTTKTVKLKI